MDFNKRAIMIYVDFDDTLYLHDKHWGADEDFEFNLKYGSGELKYKAENINNDLINVILNVKNEMKDSGKNVYVFMLTGSRISAYFEAKKRLLATEAKDIFDNYFSVSSQAEKVEFIKYHNKFFEKEHDCKIIGTIVIDDDYSVLSACNNEEYRAYTPLYFEKSMQ